MLLAIVICILLALIYLAQKTVFLIRGQAALAAFVESELNEIKAAQKLPTPPTPLAYGWYEKGWPFANDEEDRTPLENPARHVSPDDYATQMYIAEYKSIPGAFQRKEFLGRLFKEGVLMEPELLDIIYSDANVYVRAWAACHLETDFTQREIRNYEATLLQDPDPIVRAALWSNPRCKRLPWSIAYVSKEWKEQLRSMKQLERLGLMRNPELSPLYVVALLATPSEELNMSREEHAAMLGAAAVNPGLISGSRRVGRDAWRTWSGDYNPPLEEYGQMWKLCLEKWMDTPTARYLSETPPYLFMKYIQTTPEVKLSTYNHLLEKLDPNDSKWLRREVIRSCDPFIDNRILKLAWDDPDEECRGIARGMSAGSPQPT